MPMWSKIYKIHTLALTLVFASCGSNTMLKESKKLEHYPSASGIEYLNNQFYVIGDDANNLVILDSSLTIIDSIQLSLFPDKRIPKSDKPDLEAILITADKQLLFIGSGSLAPQRNQAWLINPITKNKDSIRLDVFYDRLQKSGLHELNIEGACSIPGAVILSNRGSKGNAKNHLVITRPDFWKEQQNAPITLISIGSNTDTSFFNGVSGIAYAQKSDRLLLTVSTEDTRNSMDDGAIGKSYLWFIENISSKKNWKAINPDKIIDLGNLDAAFKGQKIESLCVTKETKNFLHLVLVADNDDGSSTIFKLVAEKN